MYEFLIKCVNDDWFNLHQNQFKDVLRPNSIPSKPIQGWGNHRIEVLGCEVSFSDEDSGIQVCFECASFSESTAQEIVEEIRQNIEKTTRQSAKVLQIT